MLTGFCYFQLFRCHRIFLATSSEAFEKLLYGSFKEGNKDRDYEIVFSNVSPQVFEMAMRFDIIHFCFASNVNVQKMSQVYLRKGR